MQKWSSASCFPAILLKLLSNLLTYQGVSSRRRADLAAIDLLSFFTREALKMCWHGKAGKTRYNFPVQDGGKRMSFPCINQANDATAKISFRMVIITLHSPLPLRDVSYTDGGNLARDLMER